MGRAQNRAPAFFARMFAHARAQGKPCQPLRGFDLRCGLRGALAQQKHRLVAMVQPWREHIAFTDTLTAPMAVGQRAGFFLFGGPAGIGELPPLLPFLQRKPLEQTRRKRRPAEFSAHHADIGSVRFAHGLGAFDK